MARPQGDGRPGDGHRDGKSGHGHGRGTPREGDDPAAAGPPPDMDLERLFEVWVDSDLKAKVVLFFHLNPGVIETAEGLARRLGTSPEVLRQCVEDHIRLGVLRARDIGGRQVLVYDRARRQSIERFIQEAMRRKEESL